MLIKIGLRKGQDFLIFVSTSDTWFRALCCVLP